MSFQFSQTPTSRKDSLFLVLAASPLVLGVIVVSAIPTIVALGTSFTDLVLGYNVKWNFIGIENFRSAFQDALFLNSFRIGLIWALSVSLISIAIGLITVQLINQKEWYSSILKFGVMLPWAMSPVTVAILWQILLDPSSGPVNGILRALNLPGKQLSLLGDFNTAFPVVIVIGSWVSLPVIAVSLLASTKTIRVELLEAAQIDGANALQVFKAVTLPHLQPVITALFVLNVIWNFNSFGLVYVLTAGGPGGKTSLPALFVYQESFKYGNLGYAAALGSIITVALVALLGMYLYFRNRDEDQS